ncbi:hypothetical protein RHMOL_Rhmol06G0155500 [Rhododendron molle]|uniref:Uncharacterized protein n=1 Tax=Rhododendron molle TaxID=49168 RepID=A0ACC0NCJ7_RHOML|nr:hypothetical protein RHMOL_Rhmol06G0155500 [Rhododendron molle]
MKSERASAKVCPEICKGGAVFMICESKGNQKLSPACSCCFAGPGCTIYYNDGTFDTCS